MKGDNQCNAPCVEENNLVLWHPSPGLSGAVPSLSLPQNTQQNLTETHVELNNHPPNVISPFPRSRGWERQVRSPPHPGNSAQQAHHEVLQKAQDGFAACAEKMFCISEETQSAV